MKQQQDLHVFTGMEKDTSVSKQAANLLYDAFNIRISAIEGETALSISNERGPKQLNFKFQLYTADSGYIEQKEKDGREIKLEGVYLGGQQINHFFIIFTHITEHVDAIYRIDLSNYDVVTDTYTACRLYKGNLNFDLKHPIETLASYENEYIQKVYWTDNYNQPRLINISPDKDWYINKVYTDNYFDFIQELELKEEVTITRREEGGLFPPGVIQYVFTYYNKFMQETNIFYTSPLYYMSHSDRGGSPEDICSCLFNIAINKIDTKFDYLRVYSILRTSLNGTPVCKRVTDVSLRQDDNNNSIDSISIIDDGKMGDIIDSKELLFKGGEPILAETMCQKDGTLFLGNITLQREVIPTDIKKKLRKEYSTTSPLIIENATWITEEVPCTKTASKESFPFHLIGQNCARFKYKEYYRLGIQFQHCTGRWSDPIWIGDSQVNKAPQYDAADGSFHQPVLQYDIKDVDIMRRLHQLGYRKVRGVMASPSWLNRTILTQGVGNPTVYTSKGRYGMGGSGSSGGDLYTQASWIFRPYVGLQYAHLFNTGQDNNYPWITNNHGGQISCILKGMSNPTWELLEIASVYHYPWSSDENQRLNHNAFLHLFNSTEIQGYFYMEDRFRVDPSTLTVNTPEIVYDADIQYFNYADCKTELIGEVNSQYNYGDMDLTTSSGTWGGYGFKPRPFKTDGYGALLAQACYEDSLVDDDDDGSFIFHEYYNAPVLFPVFMWQANGPINNDVDRAGSTSVLRTKKVSNYKYGVTKYFGKEEIVNFPNIDIKPYTQSELSMVKVNDNSYQGNIDTLLNPSDFCPIIFSGTPDSRRGDWFPVYTDPPVHVLNRHDACIRRYWGDYPGGLLEYKAGSWELKPNYNSNGMFTGFDYTFTPAENDEGGVTAYYNTHNLTWLTLGEAKYDKDGNQIKGDFGSVHLITQEGYDFGDTYLGLTEKRRPVRMRYKSTPHFVVQANKGWDLYSIYQKHISPNSSFPLLEIKRNYDPKTFCGGTSEDALKQIQWIPASDPVSFEENSIQIVFKYGDTYLQRWDCLKTYAWSFEDPNQVVDILSYICESRINLDGRYDRNKGQPSNLNMSPQNYNLINRVYSQLDNYFSYRIQDSTFYKLDKFPNQFTWSLEKIAGSTIDVWPHITLSSIYDMDGSKGEIRKLCTWNDTIYCFQDQGISQIIFNPRVQIPTSDSNPIEISNNYKLEGKRYISDGVGCINKYSVKETPTGIYFIDSISQGLYHFSGEMINVSNKTKMSIYFNSIPYNKNTPLDYTCKIFHDSTKNDLYISTKDKALCLNEELGQFSSFMSYEDMAEMFNIHQNFYCIKATEEETKEYIKYAFLRSEDVPTAPSGYTYNNALPEDWEDAIPVGKGETLWYTTCEIIKSDKIIGAWSKPAKYEFTYEFTRGNTNYRRLISKQPSYTQPPIEGGNSSWLKPESITDGVCYWEAIQVEGSDGVWGDWEVRSIFNEHLNEKTVIIKYPDIYQMWKGEYNNFFGVYQPYHLTYISNGLTGQENLSVFNKTFTNISYRADRWLDTFNGSLALNDNGTSKQVFDYIRVYNEYQDTERQPLSFVRKQHSNIKEKFRTWHIEIPRNRRVNYSLKDRLRLLQHDAMYSNPDITLDDIPHYGFKSTRDRIQNPWCKIELGIYQDQENPNKDLMELHDISTVFYI